MTTFYLAAIYSHGRCQMLPFRPGFCSFVDGINDAGEVLVDYRNWVARIWLEHPPIPELPAAIFEPSRAGSTRAYFANGVMKDIGTAKGPTGDVTIVTPQAINDAGQIVGTDSEGHEWLVTAGKAVKLKGFIPGGVEIPAGVRWIDSKHWVTGSRKRESIVSPTGLNAAGEVVGWAEAVGGEHAFLFSQGEMHDLAELMKLGNSGAEAINDAGEIVIGARAANGRGHVFLCRDGVMHDLGVPAGFDAIYVKGINRSGAIIGDAYKYLPHRGIITMMHAVLYAHGHWIDLNTRVNLAGTALKTLTSTVAINDAGQIIGGAYGRVGGMAYLLTPKVQK